MKRVDFLFSLDGIDGSNALDAIEKIKAAITKVSAQRSELGAVQNRLEHTINNLNNVIENTTSAESAIRDTDMAAEMVEYSKLNILFQVGQAMRWHARRKQRSRRQFRIRNTALIRRKKKTDCHGRNGRGAVLYFVHLLPPCCYPTL